MGSRTIKKVTFAQNIKPILRKPSSSPLLRVPREEDCHSETRCESLLRQLERLEDQCARQRALIEEQNRIIQMYTQQICSPTTFCRPPLKSKSRGRSSSP